MLHYNPQTCFEQYLAHLQEEKLYYYSQLRAALNRHTVRLFTESDDTRGCNNTICPPEDEQGVALNILRIIM